MQTVVAYSCGLDNICIVEKITKFDNQIFLDFRAAGVVFAGSTICLQMAEKCFHKLGKLHCKYSEIVIKYI